MWVFMSQSRPIGKQCNYYCSLFNYSSSIFKPTGCLFPVLNPDPYFGGNSDFDKERNDKKCYKLRLKIGLTFYPKLTRL